MPKKEKAAVGTCIQLTDTTWRLQVSNGFDANGKRLRPSMTVEAKNEKEARKLLAAFVTQVEKGEYQESVKMDFEKLFEKWIDSHQGEKKLAGKTEQRYREMFNTRIKDYFNRFKIEKIKTLDIDDFFIKLRKAERLDGKEGKLSERTILHHYRLIHAIFEYAQQKQIIKNNPMDFTEKISVEDNELASYDEVQANKLLDLMEGVELKFRVIINLALASGCRIGELSGLTWNCVDFENNTINITKVAQYLHKLDKDRILEKYPDTPHDLLERNIIIKPPKTKKSKRNIPIHSEVMELLSEYQHQQKIKRMELANKWKDTNWVFTEETGDLMHPHTASKWFHKFLKRHNTSIMQDESIPEGKKKDYLLDEICFHALRHSSASLLIAKGNDVAVVSKRLGHSNIATTTKFYIHSSDTMSRKAADSMDMFSRKKRKDDKANA